jgi:hypothetical protein
MKVTLSLQTDGFDKSNKKGYNYLQSYITYLLTLCGSFRYIIKNNLCQ